MSDDRNGFVGLMCFLTGAALGAGLALIFAPQSGEETRKKIKDISGKVSDEVKESYEKLNKEARKSIEQVKAAADNAVDHVKSFVEGAKEGLKKEIKSELKEETGTVTPAKKKA
jgi:gas vesicle protein